MENVRALVAQQTLAEAGLADLVQKRHDFEDYSYILVARHRPRRAAHAVLPILLAEAA